MPAEAKATLQAPTLSTTVNSIEPRKEAGSASIKLVTPTAGLPGVSSAVTATRTVSLPIVNSAVQQTVFGIASYNLADSKHVSAMVDSKATWVRRIRLFEWMNAQPTESGGINWGAFASAEQEILAMSSKGIQIVAVVQGTPSWAQAVAGKTCGAIRSDKLVKFGDFLQQLVARYSVAPYNIKHFELYNEPDVAPNLVEDTSEFGCWGADGDTYYGGRTYGEMLKVAYPRIKSGNPAAQVLIGGLLLDCRPPGRAPTNTCIPAHFLEGILDIGAGNAFDIVSFHGYDYFDNTLGRYVSVGWDSSSSTTGPVSIAKASFIREVLASRNVTGKRLMNTESALVVWQAPGGTVAFPADAPKQQAFDDTKRNYMAQVMGAAMVHNIDANIWFDLNGWQASGLIDANGDRPARLAMRNMRTILPNPSAARTLTNAELGGSTDAMGYGFVQSGKQVWLIWTKTAASATVTLPQTPVSINNVVGITQTVTGATIALDGTPLFVKFP